MDDSSKARTIGKNSFVAVLTSPLDLVAIISRIRTRDFAAYRIINGISWCIHDSNKTLFKGTGGVNSSKCLWIYVRFRAILDVLLKQYKGSRISYVTPRATHKWIILAAKARDALIP